MPYKFSPSSLSLLKDCPRCFWLHFNKGIKRPDSIFPSLPSGMDRILKAHFDNFRDKGLLPPELAQLNGEVRLFNNVELLKVWRNNLKGVQWTDESGNLIRGAIDNLLQKQHRLIVLDYKTRGFQLKEDTPNHYQDALDIYNFLLRKNEYETEDYSYLLFYHPNKVSEGGEVIFNTDLIKMHISIHNAEQVIQKALETLKGSMPNAPDDCGFCKWVKICGRL